MVDDIIRFRKLSQTFIRGLIKMAGIPDLTVCSDLPVTADHILAVGWLDRSLSFPTGPTQPDVFRRLLQFAKQPWQPFVSMGRHECELCQFEGEKSGTANLYFPFDGKIYVAPELITHYMNAHHYQPPAVFCDAVMACPDMESMEYKKLLIQCRGTILWKPSAS